MDIRAEFASQCCKFLQNYTVGMGIHQDIYGFLNSSLSWIVSVRSLLMRVVAIEMEREDDTDDFNDMFSPMMLMEEQICKALSRITIFIEASVGIPQRRYKSKSLENIIGEIYSGLNRLDVSHRGSSEGKDMIRAVRSSPKNITQVPDAEELGTSKLILLEEEIELPKICVTSIPVGEIPHSPRIILHSPKTESVTPFSEKITPRSPKTEKKLPILLKEEETISSDTMEICEKVSKFIESSIRIFNSNTKIGDLYNQPQEGTSKRSLEESKQKAEDSIFQQAISRCKKAINLINKRYEGRFTEIQGIKLISDLQDHVVRGRSFSE